MTAYRPSHTTVPAAAYFDGQHRPREATCHAHPGERFPCAGCRAIVATIKARLADPGDVAERLGIKHPKGEGWICPAHSGACLSLTRGPDRTLRVKCFGCDLSGDVLDLIAAVEGVDRDRHFAEVVKRGAELAGISLDPGAPLPPLPPRPPPPPPRPYPPDAAQLWSASRPIGDDAAAAAWARSRGLDVYAIEDRGLARVIPLGAKVPGWASYERRPWTSTGHRVLLPVFDAGGVLRSVRAVKIDGEGDTPKRLPPGGYRASSLVLADALGQLVLAGQGRAGWPAQLDVVVLEGETDWIARASSFSDADETAPAVFGVFSGAWTAEHAARIPDGVPVTLRLDRDDAGDRYGEEIAATLAGRCPILETHPAERAERRRTRPQREAERRAQARSAGEVRP